jgi:hypothetical protein
VTKESGHTILPHIPEHKSWVITMWHFGRDASIEYTGEKFSTTWEIGENELIRIYTKQFRCSAATLKEPKRALELKLELSRKNILNQR